MTPPRSSIIAVDPGKMSGVALLGPDGSFRSWEFRWPMVNRSLEKYALECHKARTPLRIVGERFDMVGTRGRQDDLTWSLKILGVWQNEADRYGFEFVEYGRSDCKSFLNNGALRKLGWYLRSGGGHALDAARVLGRDLSLSDRTYWHSLVVGSGLLGEEERP